MIRRFAPLIALVSLIALAWATGLHRWLDLDALAERRDDLAALVEANPLLMGVGYVLLYAVATALSLPGGAVLTVAGGFLFGLWLGGALAVTGATLGACAVFLVARSSLGAALRERAGPWLSRLETGFAENAVSYMLALRLAPVFPFWLVNLAPALLGVRFDVYALTTLVGIIPGGLAFASLGAGLDRAAAAGEVSLAAALSPELIMALSLLALLALAPALWRRIRARRAGRAEG